ncbi:PRC-barrel domain containing protein [Natronosalvus vescus]|uniref:PRC-barrel domain containing protein n=1 Tax=Natronosalvus vescus TaxID=2953881 RepID=UPI002090C3CC|nr:PRC-barrel domain containing protein [Natronosalvus vescus]
MSARFSGDDQGKTVVNANGDRIGIVEDVRDGTAYVNPDPGMADTIKSKLGWGDVSGENYELDDTNVERITDDEIRLERM